MLLHRLAKEDAEKRERQDRQNKLEASKLKKRAEEAKKKVYHIQLSCCLSGYISILLCVPMGPGRHRVWCYEYS